MVFKSDCASTDFMRWTNFRVFSHSNSSSAIVNRYANEDSAHSQWKIQMSFVVACLCRIKVSQFWCDRVGDAQMSKRTNLKLNQSVSRDGISWSVSNEHEKYTSSLWCAFTNVQNNKQPRTAFSREIVATKKIQFEIL